MDGEQGEGAAVEGEAGGEGAEGGARSLHADLFGDDDE